MVTSLNNPNILYEDASHNKNREIRFWGDVPTTFNDAVHLVISNFRANIYSSSDEGRDILERFKKVLLGYHRKLGIASSKMEENLDLLDEGSILVGQQPIVFGGPGFIGNKIGCLQFLDKLFQENEKPLAPVYFISDYDGLQKELTRSYFPNPISHNAIIIESEDFLPENSNIAVHRSQLPPESWLNINLNKITENLKGFKKSLKGPNKALFDERWDHIRTIIKTSYNSANTLSEWAAKIWGTLSNICADLGVIFLPASNPEIRKLVAPKYEKFIQNRKKYVEVFLETTHEIQNLGCKPSLPHRHDNYAPFTLECNTDGNRIVTSIEVKNHELIAKGKCPSCNEIKSYDVDSYGNLLDIATMIGPRVDTSQAIFQDLLNIRIRISGPGEIAYYAQVAPALRSIGFDLPVFVKYKRAFYGKNSTEKLGKELEKLSQGTLNQPQLFSILRERMNALKIDDITGIGNAEHKMNDFIKEQYNNLLKGKQSIDVKKYLGWQFGRFEKHKFGQEVSWAWFDLAIQTGATDYIRTYQRLYTKHSILGGSYFINSQL